MPRWPLALIALPAAVAVWSGWVGLGALCGFGEIHPLPGIWDNAHLNTAITLPIGVEAYGAYALAAWLHPRTPDTARKFAKRSALGALALGMLGQVVYHLLSAAHATRAPWPVVVLVSCLPVLVLGMGTGLAHLLREPALDAADVVTTPADETAMEAVAAVNEDVPVVEPVDIPVYEPVIDVPTASIPRPRTVAPKRTRRGSGRSAPEHVFGDEISRGELPSLRSVMRQMNIGAPRAREVLAGLEAALDDRVTQAA
jgi:hypothetical protein